MSKARCKDCEWNYNGTCTFEGKRPCNYKCETCKHSGEMSIIGNCIKCRNFDRYER